MRGGGGEESLHYIDQYQNYGINILMITYLKVNFCKIASALYRLEFFIKKLFQ
jgi:hypothetical protein